MYCQSPTLAYRFKGINPETSKAYKPFRFLRFTSDEAFLSASSEALRSDVERLVLPCGKCLLCTRAYRRMWALRCSHELRFYDSACFLTLTVNDSCINVVFPKRSHKFLSDTDLALQEPPQHVFTSQWNSLAYEPFQLFIKRLRRYIDYHKIPLPKPLRYFMCGEYGDNTHRPHYHVILFGFCPSDLQPLLNHHGLYVSKIISDLWPYGFHTIGKVSFDTISYVAGYVDKKLDCARMAWVDNDVAPEFVRMSRGCKKIGTGGIGKSFFDAYCDTDLYPVGKDGVPARLYALHRGKPVRMPDYYDDLLLLRNPDKYAIIKAARQVGAAELDVPTWLDESHRKHAVMLCKRKSRDPSIVADVY